MKKFISFVMAAVLCVGMTTTVFAAESVSTDKAGDAAGTITSVKSEDANVTINSIDPIVDTDLVEEIEEKNFAKDTAREILGYENVKSAETLGYFELNATGAGKVTFNCSSISKGNKILV